MDTQSINHVKINSSTTQYDRRSKSLMGLGIGTCILFFGLIAASSFFVKIEGSVISPSQVVSTGNNKTVQHRDGGTIKKLLVKNGDSVAQGTPVLVLDGQAIQAEYNVMKFRQVELKAKIARLNGTLDGRQTYSFFPLRPRRTNKTTQDRLIDQAIKTQEELFYASQNNLISAQRTLQERSSFYQSELSALQTQIQTTQRQLGVISDQIQEVKPLIAEKLVARSKEWQLNRDMINAQAQLDQLGVQKVKTESALSETKNELVQYLTTQRRSLLDELETAQTELQSVGQSYQSLGERLSRLVVKAPFGGTVHNLNFHNAQAVLKPGEIIMEIVPQNFGQQLLARVQPTDIDQVSFGQDVRLRFEAFDANTTPEIFGTVQEISADRFTDKQTGIAYYEVSIAMSQEQLSKLGDKKIVAGMPATAMFRTTDRSLFSYLAQPIEQQASRAFH